MTKKVLGAILLWLCLCGAAYGAEPVTAQGSNTVVLVNGVAREVYPYNIGGSNYFKLRDMAAILSSTSRSFSVKWDAQQNAIVMDTGASYETQAGDLQFPAGKSQMKAEPSQVELCCDGETVETAAYNIGGNNYFKLRDIGEAADFMVLWNDTTQLMEIYTGSEPDITIPQEAQPGAPEEEPSPAPNLDDTVVPDGMVFVDSENPSGTPAAPDSAEEPDPTLPDASEPDPDGDEVELDASFTDPNYWDNLEQENGEDPAEEEDTQEAGEIVTDVRQLLNTAPLSPKGTQFAILDELVEQFMDQNFTPDMDTYTKAKVAYDYFINNMTYKTATELDMSMFSREEASAIWKCYPERYAVPILLDHNGVCNHYSSAYAAILRAIGLDVRVVSGSTKSSAGGYSSHVWVTVCVDGVEYLFDPQVEQRIAQRNGGQIQYARFGKAVRTMTKDYRPSAQYRFAESL